MKDLRRKTKKILTSVAGGLIIIGGLIMLITPGPGWLTIILGLGLLATEYAWAHHLLSKAKDYYEKTKKKALKKVKK
jgi:uncharacterized protein (TIGR02611 family)